MAKKKIAALEKQIDALIPNEEEEEQLELEEAEQAGTRYIYARVSTQEQNVDQQAAHLLKTWSDAVVFKEKMTGATLDRPVLKDLEKQLKQGDSILVLSINRVGRNTEEIISFIAKMKKLGVSIHVQDLGYLDITHSAGKVVVATLAAVAELQREEILEKQRIGIARAKQEDAELVAQGKAKAKYKGKQQSAKTVKACKSAMEDIERGLSKQKAANANGIGIATLYRWIKQEELAAKFKQVDELVTVNKMTVDKACDLLSIDPKLFENWKKEQDK
ncbi:recombinase family protein [Aliivibrio fischeri]|nr:recombinase family protein [Aliivibrio fischeri]